MVTFDEARLLAVALLNLCAKPTDPVLTKTTELSLTEKRSGLLMACMRLAEQMLCEIGDWDTDNVIEGLRALTKDMSRNIEVHCAIHGQDAEGCASSVEERRT